MPVESANPMRAVLEPAARFPVTRIVEAEIGPSGFRRPGIQGFGLGGAHVRHESAEPFAEVTAGAKRPGTEIDAADRQVKKRRAASEQHHRADIRHLQGERGLSRSPRHG